MALHINLKKASGVFTGLPGKILAVTILAVIRGDGTFFLIAITPFHQTAINNFRQFG
ncbi:hypothetical protein [Atlantibacter hermannii]|uniref:hypothetical protein n=1 Tax=Atlantibacter hermannii TaxID=565 RepID=UPI0034D75218